MIKITSADRYFSLCIRERAGWRCERCGTQYAPPTTALQCAHYHSRGSWSTRFDPSNAIAMCMGCHFYTSTHRDEHAKTHLAAVGELEFDRIHFDSKRPAHRIKASKADIARFYRDTLKDMQRLRDAGVSGRLNFDGWVP